MKYDNIIRATFIKRLNRFSNVCLYKIIGFAEHTETGERMAVYQALYGDFGIYVRSYDMFMGKVDRDKYPDIMQE